MEEEPAMCKTQRVKDAVCIWSVRQVYAKVTSAFCKYFSEIKWLWKIYRSAL